MECNLSGLRIRFIRFVAKSSRWLTGASRGERTTFTTMMRALRRLPASWTSVAAPSLFETISAGQSHFRTQDLLQLVALIATRQEVQPPQKRQRARVVSSK